MKQTVIVIDFGAQYSQVIARKVRECDVYCEVVPFTTSLEDILARKPIGIILSGGPSSVYQEGAPTIDPSLFDQGVPVLGICYGMQLMVSLLGGKVAPAKGKLSREYGKTLTRFRHHCALFRDLPNRSITWMSHGDAITEIPSGFEVCAETDHCPYAAIFDEERGLYGVQFHPEVEHTEKGEEMIRTFLVSVCHAQGDWSMHGYLESAVAKLREEIGSRRVLLALSGGVDSSVAAVFLSRAVGKQLTCMFVDHGLMRLNEVQEITDFYGGYDLNFIKIDAKEEFLSALKGVAEPEKKRAIIGNKFIEVFAREAAKLGTFECFAQGTIYPDVIESGALNGNKIKSHHNVGGLPEHLPFHTLIEPLRILFKDEVRKLGLALGMPPALVFRQPFPGPGLAVRIIGEITEEKIMMAAKADAIFRETMTKYGYADKADQYFAVLTNLHAVGVMGDVRTYGYTVALRAVTTDDFMTARYLRLPYDILDEASSRIVNEVDGINRVVYDVTSKPPATIEYE